MTQKSYFVDRPNKGYRAVLVQIDFGHADFESLLNEFIELAHSADLEVIHVITSRRKLPMAKYFLGEGKTDEIAAIVKQNKIEVVLINHPLTAAQARNLEQLFSCRVLDRTDLILDIFAQRAKSAEGKFQVELAQLKHLRTRLIRGWTHLERQKGGIGLRGPGETQLETDRRLIDVRIKGLEKRLEKVRASREQRRRARLKAVIPTISLVGYTNAGKSTLFNRLAQANVYVANQLFATLDPTLRQIKLPPIGDIIIADTVGFIRDLPHDLIAAFRATLEETCEADLLLHVVDCSHPNYLQMMTNVKTILTEIGANQIPTIEVYNKVDLSVDQKSYREITDSSFTQRVWVSAATGVGIDLLQQAIVEILQDPVLYCEVHLGPMESKLRAALYDIGAVQSEEMTASGECILQLRIRHIDCHRLLPHKVIHNTQSS